MLMCKELHFIGNAHLDIVWLWDYEEGCQEIRATFRSALDRIKEHDTFIFSCASTMHYEFVKKIDPMMFKEIQESVRNGRWYLCGGWYIQPDCNAPSGESFVRHGLYGQKFFKENFGIISDVGYNVDSFGHNANLPQILKGQGMDQYVFMRPFPEEQRTFGDHVFYWEGVNGDVVLAFRIPLTYTTRNGFLDVLPEHVGNISAIAEEEGIPFMCFYGVGNHGGGPTKANIRKIDELSKSAEGWKYVFSSPSIYFDRIRKLKKVYPTYKGELQHHAIGCYSLMSEVKKHNSRCERELVQLEILESLFWKDGKEKNLSELWKKVLLNQFHDIMGGCCIPYVYDGVFSRYGYVEDSIRERRNNLIQRLGASLETRNEDNDMTLLVVNTSSFEKKDVVRCNCLFDSITNLDGRSLDYQIVRNAPTGGFYAYGTDVEVTVPPMGYTVFRMKNVVPELPPEQVKQLSKEIMPQASIRRGGYEIEFNTEEGVVGPIYHDGIKILDVIYPTVVNDNSDAWSHNQFGYYDVVNKLRIESIKNISFGKLYTEYCCKYSLGETTLDLFIRLYEDMDRVDLRLKTFWSQHHKLLRLCFKSDEQSDSYFSAIPYGVIERNSDSMEWPCQRWIARHFKNHSVAILNSHVYSCSGNRNTLSYTLLRSPVGAHHIPAVVSDATLFRYTDQGEHEWNFTLLATPDKQTLYEAVSLMQDSMQNPLISMMESVHAGNALNTCSFGSLSDTGVILAAMKTAEDGEGVIIRFVEEVGMDHVFKFNFNFKDFELSIKPYEILSMKYLDGRLTRVDLLENEI